MAGKWLAVLCDRDAALAARLGQDAEQQRVFFCAIDQPQNNSFSHVGLSRSGPLFIAVGTEGKAPALARRLKLEFERLLQEPTFSDFVAMLVRVRERTDPKQRKHELNRLASKLRLSGGFVIDE
jgi:siroheme synthase-like protein